MWLDQTGLRSDAAVGTTWAPVGQTPVVSKTGKRFGVNVMAAISNRSELYFTCYHGSFTGPVFLAYLDRLARHLDRKIHLIVDGVLDERVTGRLWPVLAGPELVGRAQAEAGHVDGRRRVLTGGLTKGLRRACSEPVQPADSCGWTPVAAVAGRPGRV